MSVLPPSILRWLRLAFCLAAGALLLACGGGGSPSASPAPGLSLLAGHIGGKGNIDGIGTQSRMMGPAALVFDAAGRLIVGDSVAVRSVGPDGSVGTIAGFDAVAGTVNGPVAQAQFYAISSIAADGLGNIYVGESDGIRRITPQGEVSTYFYRGGGGLPMAADAAGNLFYLEHGTVMKLAPGQAPLAFAQARGDDIVIDPDGRIYLADAQNLVIRQVDPDGTVSTLAGSVGASGSADGAGTEARFRKPMRLALDRTGHLYVVDEDRIRKITPEGVVSTPSLPAYSQHFHPLGPPSDIAVDADGNLYFAAETLFRIVKITPQGDASTFAGLTPDRGQVDGTGAEARFEGTVDVISDPAGNAYVLEGNTPWSLLLRRVSPAGEVTTLARPGLGWGELPSDNLQEQYGWVTGLARDSAGNFYVVERRRFIGEGYWAGGGVVRKITPAGALSVVAGPQQGLGWDLSAVASDSGGTLYVADGNAIRKIDPDGTVSTLVEAVASPFGHQVVDLALAPDGSLLVSSTDAAVRRVTPQGAVTLLAGEPGVQGHVDGTASQARFLAQGAIAVDAQGVAYVLSGTTVRRITPDGVVTTLAGVPLRRGVRLGPLPGYLDGTSLAVAADRTLLVTAPYAVLRLVVP